MHNVILVVSGSLRSGYFPSPSVPGLKDILQVRKMLKFREVHVHLSNTIVGGNEAANVIAEIVAKPAWSPRAA